VVVSSAARFAVTGEVSHLAARVRSEAEALGLLGWVRLDEPPSSLGVHAEGPADSLEQLGAWLRELQRVTRVEVSRAKVEGHEQFTVRGIPAGVFVVQEHQATAHHFDFRLEVDGVMRSWAVPKGPSLDPSVKRLALQVEDHGLSHNDFEGPALGGGVIVWDHGSYEQGGRVPWPDALDRGHAVFVLRGEKLQGGFALQRTSSGEKPQWLLIKRRDEHARSGSDITRERPESVLTGRTLTELLDMGVP
jgi:DNA ligase D-like protein (predicted 3'-phosphoesterase)